MIMTYTPFRDDGPQSSFNERGMRFDNVLGRRLRDPFNPNPGNTSRLPSSVAPIALYDEDEQSNDRHNNNGKVKAAGSKVKNVWGRFEDYLDRRAQASYVS